MLVMIVKQMNIMLIIVIIIINTWPLRDLKPILTIMSFKQILQLDILSTSCEIVSD